jgi:hypothetical protein
VPIDIGFETHSLTEDNEAGLANGWLDGRRDRLIRLAPSCAFRWRLRDATTESNGAPASAVHGNRLTFQDAPYPGGESWGQATGRVRGFLKHL